MKFNKIHIYLKQCKNNKLSYTRPLWFDYERTFKSLLDSINWGLCNLTVCFDGDITNHWTLKYIEKYNFRIELIDSKSYTGQTYGNNDHLGHQAACLTAQIIKKDNLPEDSLIFIVENDYLFRPIDWATIVLDLYNNINNGNLYCSLYEHLDTYIFTQNEETINKFNLEKHWGMYQNLVSKIFLSSYWRWRTVPSITSTWIMSKQLFDRDFDLHSVGISDNSGCLEFINRGSVCVSPLPSINTHCEQVFLAPLISWEEINNDIKLL